MSLPSTKILDCRAGWTLHHPDNVKTYPVDAPFDVHSTLLAAGDIPDPYWRDQELQLDWIHESEWVIRQEFLWEPPDDDVRSVLVLSRVDCCASIVLNGFHVGSTDNLFRTYRFDLSQALRAGANTLEILFHSNTAVALERATQFPFELPYQTGNNRIAHVNYLRKTQCDAGWDWNIALMPIGVYGQIDLHTSRTHRFDEIKCVQHHNDSTVHLEVTTYVHAYTACSVNVSIALGEHALNEKVTLTPGDNACTFILSLENPDLWWPAGYGPQTLHQLAVSVDQSTKSRNIGFRLIELITEKDEVGEGFGFRVNGKMIFAKGANWIPADALPSHSTDSKVRSLLQSAVDAHFNMIRVWGGGRYESDSFYNLCDELGLLVWQDFMFSCNHYPAADFDWLNSVRAEASEQIRRLSTHACMALWCGDNELVGALSWFEVTRANRDRYLANYVILNHALEEQIIKESIDVPFWPSSPSSGRLNFGDAWHDDRSGDMHFWDVWHESKSFEHYRSVTPRFCSEFGFQSFPSMTCIERFTKETDRNVSSTVMDVHQRNEGGNARIVETITRYFRFPDSFEKMVFLSQIGQALAMQTAVEWWRANKPHTMGTLYWQLNDTWPVASWASLEHGGAWKLTHYAARNFYSPVMVTVQPPNDRNKHADAESNANANADAESMQMQMQMQTVLPCTQSLIAQVGLQ